jgi:uncharacterized protein
MDRVTDNRADGRYELPAGAEPAIAAYDIADGVITFTHTVVPESAQGRGLGTQLIREALADARQRGLRVRAECGFVAAYLARHPEAAELHR